MHLKKTALASIVTSALALCAAPALGATSDDGTSQGKARAVGGQDVSGEISAALQRDLGLSASQVKEQRAQQAKAIKLDQTLQDSLGGAYAGSSYNAKAGKLVVMVSDEAQASKARAAGADVRVVKHSKARLDAIKDALDVAAGKKGPAPPTARPAARDRRPWRA